MSIKNITTIAQDIIAQTASIVAPNTVNLMDENGIIIASSDQKRIGTFHSGALLAIKEKKEIDIFPDEVESYEGAKQGVNIPIIKNGKAIAVIGIFGNPNEVKQTALLLSISTSLFLDQAADMKREQRRMALRSNLSEILYSKNCENDFCEIIDALGISITFPIQAILLSFTDTKITYNKVYQILKAKKLINNNTDILLEYPSHYLLMKSTQNKALNISKFKDLLAENKLNKIVVSPTISHISDLHFSILISKALMLLPYDYQIYNGDNFDDLVLLAFDDKSRDYLSKYYSDMKCKLDSINSYWLYPTVEAYINNDGKVQAIANSLNIHKNTCIYRINKILEICDLKNCTCFTIFYFFRAIIHLKKID
jgi:carbohydrate diacid regulator